MKNTGEFSKEYVTQEEAAAKLRFFLACEKHRTQPAPGGIGTLSEKTLHAVLKLYVEPDTSKHEVPLCGYVADVLSDNGIIEIQTRSFDKLRKKLSCFLENTDKPITIVHPIPAYKRVIWIDQKTGESSAPRKSPKTGCFFDAYPELYKLCDLIEEPRISIRLLLIDMDEYRLLDGYSADRKRGSNRFERIPTALAGEALLASANDHKALLPAELENEFTAAQLAKAIKRPNSIAYAVLRVMTKVGAVIPCGKKGRAKLFKKA